MCTAAVCKVSRGLRVGSTHRSVCKSVAESNRVAGAALIRAGAHALNGATLRADWSPPPAEPRDWSAPVTSPGTPTRRITEFCWHIYRCYMCRSFSGKSVKCVSENLSSIPHTENSGYRIVCFIKPDKYNIECVLTHYLKVQDWMPYKPSQLRSDSL